jgi:hypothetical protein
MIAGSVPNRTRFKRFVDQNNDKPPYHYTRWNRAAVGNYLEQIGCHNVFVDVVDHGNYIVYMLNGINVMVKSRLMPQVDRSDLSMYTIEELSSAETTASSRMRVVQTLKRVKVTATRPIERSETLISKTYGKGQTLYFEGRLSPD